jgi:hypothetical protein
VNNGSVSLPSSFLPGKKNRPRNGPIKSPKHIG